MMTDRELMQQALAAMLNNPDDISDEMFESIKALKERLAQAKQEPVAPVKSIWERRGEIERARVKKNQELMGEYDRTVYYPAMLALQKECEEGEGHHGGKYHDNGFGWSWFYCGKCGARYDITGPNGEKK